MQDGRCSGATSQRHGPADTSAYDVDGNPVALPCTHNVFSLCLHSDMPTALANVQAARAVFNRYTKVLN